MACALLTAVAAVTGGSCAVADGPQAGDSTPVAFRLRKFEPDSLRWKDIADRAYGPAFTQSYCYQYELANLELTWDPGAQPPSGRLVARRLKPNFAYQLKLMGRQGLLGPEAQDNRWDQQAWASYQLGQCGRWWCEDCDWNTYDGDLRWHVRRGHKVVGYIVFDWFVTDAEGRADVSFTVESSYHVLWQTGQRKPGRSDSSPRSYTLQRGEYAYAGGAPEPARKVKLFGEWESGRSLPGQLELPPGEYEVFLNLTEESFHASSAEGGGHWAQVLEAPIRFTVAPPATAEGSASWSALGRWLGQSWGRARTVTLAALKR
jgi:hypothetical protein